MLYYRCTSKKFEYWYYILVDMVRANDRVGTVDRVHTLFIANTSSTCEPSLQ